MLVFQIYATKFLIELEEEHSITGNSSAIHVSLRCQPKDNNTIGHFEVVD